MEPTLGEWVANIVAVGREVWRVLRDDGTFWINVGDAYDSGTSAKRKPSKDVDVGGWQQAGQMGDERVNAGLGAKQLMGQPWRVAFALQDAGWLLRSAIVWHKPNPMPESVRDRPTNAYEMVFLLAKGPKYFYDAEAIRQPNTDWTLERMRYPKPGHSRRDDSAQDSGINDNAARNYGPGTVPSGANARSVWTIPTQGRSDAHFATFPDELPRRCILAGTSGRGVCAACGAPWVRVVEKESRPNNNQHGDAAKHKDGLIYRTERFGNDQREGGQTLGWQPTCGCNADCPHHGKTPNQRKPSHVPNGRTKTSSTGWTPQREPPTGWEASCTCGANVIPATVLDCFAGSGTTLAVAQSLGRLSVGCDLNREYLEIARRYIGRADGITLSLGL